ncbi:MAG: divergent PAP2 family protein [Proteobacteria bacterium]|nr:divergent PAP2 family protein [Pseudomonadota bacterium]HNB02017.1 divergent PAP2 family protein [Nitrosomonas sp.]
MNIDISYLITPVVAWLVAGIIKFIINSFKTRKLAFSLIGYGGLPSNHSAIVSSAAALIAFKEGIDHPAFGVAVALAFIVMLDANSLRKQIGKQAEAINHLSGILGSTNNGLLRERMGHSKVEIAAGVLVGTAVAFFIQSVFSR